MGNMQANQGIEFVLKVPASSEIDENSHKKQLPGNRKRWQRRPVPWAGRH
jgi:hypothetical protein